MSLAYDQTHLFSPQDLGGNEVCDSDYDYLRMRKAPAESFGGRTFRCVDLFAGSGGSALGVHEACRSFDIKCEVPFALDFERAACAVYRHNFPDANIVEGDVHDYFDRDLESPIKAHEKRLASKIGPIDLLIGGPPCQGHSDLNNFSRRSDPKNALYASMARAARVLKPRFVIIENVQGMPHDRNGVFQDTLSSLIEQGYTVEAGLIDLTRIGVPQKRRRHIVIASKNSKLPKLEQLVAYNDSSETRDVRWAIGDLPTPAGKRLADTPAKPSKDNQRRIDYLFENGLLDLPNEQRPPCHRDKKQTYTSVYGRLRWDAPSQTITSGFYSMCMGRYVHPSERRTLTAHEAARLQFFPDFFSFEAAGSRTSIATLIGNAVPMKLSYTIVRSLLDLELRNT